MITRAYVRHAVERAGVRPDDQEDAVQDVLLALWLEHVRPEHEKMAVRRRAVDAARRYGWHRRGFVRPTFVSLPEEADFVAPPLYEDEYRPLRRRFRQVVRKLDSRDRALLWALARGIPMVRVAPLLGLSTGHVSFLHRRAVRRMRALAA